MWITPLNTPLDYTCPLCHTVEGKEHPGPPPKLIGLGVSLTWNKARGGGGGSGVESVCVCVCVRVFVCVRGGGAFRNVWVSCAQFSYAIFRTYAGWAGLVHSASRTH